MFKYIKNSFVWCPVAININKYNHFNRMIYAILNLCSSVITIITFGVFNFSWPYDYAKYLLFKERKQK